MLCLCGFELYPRWVPLKEVQWNLPMTIVGQRTGNIRSLHRVSFSYISLLLGYKKIFRYIEVSLYPVALLRMITVKDSISRPFTDLNKAKLYSIRNNQQKHNSVMPAFM